MNNKQLITTSITGKVPFLTKTLTPISSKFLNYNKLLEWAKLLSITGSSQALIQGIGFASGILIIRLLPTEEYALYTIANTMLGTMIILADSGISTNVLSQGGKVWEDREKLGSVLATGLHLRKWFAIVSLLVASPVLIYLLLKHGAGLLTSVLILAGLIPAFLASLSGNMFTIAPLLHQTIKPLLKIQVKISLVRLALIVVGLLLSPFGYVALFAAAISQLSGNRKLRQISNEFVNWEQKPDPEVQRKIISVVKRVLPGSIYYCVSSQITIALISFFGTTANVAQVGALGRISMILGLFSATFGTLIIPRFARLIGSRKLLFKRFLQIQTGIISLFATVVATSAIFPKELLWLLGSAYSGLELPLILSITGGCISLYAGLLFNLCTSRNWIMSPFLSIPTTLAVMVCGAIIIDISTLLGILKLNILVGSFELALALTYATLKLWREK